MKQGKIITLSGISGIGKSYLKSYVLEHIPSCESLISVTTRSARIGEINGIDKFFYSVEKFEEEKEKNSYVLLIMFSEIGMPIKILK